MVSLTENITKEFDSFFAKLCLLFEQGKDAPMMIWHGTAGQPWLRAFMVCCLIGLVGALLYTLFSFFKAGWKEKLHMLFLLLVIIIVLLVIFYFALMR